MARLRSGLQIRFQVNLGEQLITAYNPKKCAPGWLTWGSNAKEPLALIPVLNAKAQRCHEAKICDFASWPLRVWFFRWSRSNQ